MSVNIDRARHRSARRPATALDDFASAATGSLAVVGRRSAVVAAPGGLVVSMAVPASAEGSANALPAVDTSALTAPAHAALATSPVVSVPTDASWDFASPDITVAANPKPVVVAPVVAARTTTTTSRSETRTEVAEAAPVASAPVPQSVAGNAVLEIASRYVGVPYVSGGTTPSGFDCSGFTSYVYAQLGVSLPRTSSSQRYAGTVVSRANALPGDLIWSPGHISIYAGGNQQIDAPRPGKSVQFRAIWQSNPVFIRVAS